MKIGKAALVLIAAILVSMLVGRSTAEAANQDWSSTSCNVEARATEELLALMFDDQGTPLATVAREDAAAVLEADLPQGEPVDAETEAAINAVVHQWLHCMANGEETRALAVMSDTFAYALMSLIYANYLDAREELRIALDSSSIGTPIAELVREFETGGRAIRQLADGRIGGIWNVEGDKAMFILVRGDTGWLVDEVIDIIEEATPTA